MNKTPIMILQELGVKESILPKYDVIVSQNGSHENLFTYKVKYNDLYADGTASNKKGAKQNAAQNMLKLLLETNNISEQGLKLLQYCNSHIATSKSPMSNSSAASSNSTNFIGILQEYCNQNRLIEPVYQLCEVNGPAHNMTFKMTCTLGSITEVAVANTKKQVKQQVAQKVLQKLPNLTNITGTSKCKPLNDNPRKEEIEAAFQDLGIQITKLKIVDSKELNNVKLKYAAITSREKLKPSMYLNEKITVDTYHLYYKSMIYNNICNSKYRELNVLQETLQAYALKCNKNNLVVLKEILTYITDTCKLPVQKISLRSKTNMTIIGFRVNVMVPLIQFGINQNPLEAEQEALSKTIEAIIFYLQ